MFGYGYGSMHQRLLLVIQARQDLGVKDTNFPLHGQEVQMGSLMKRMEGEKFTMVQLHPDDVRHIQSSFIPHIQSQASDWVAMDMDYSSSAFAFIVLFFTDADDRLTTANITLPLNQFAAMNAVQPPPPNIHRNNPPPHGGYPHPQPDAFYGNNAPGANGFAAQPQNCGQPVNPYHQGLTPELRGLETHPYLAKVEDDFIAAAYVPPRVLSNQCMTLNSALQQIGAGVFKSVNAVFVTQEWFEVNSELTEHGDPLILWSDPEGPQLMVIIPPPGKPGYGEVLSFMNRAVKDAVMIQGTGTSVLFHSMAGQNAMEHRRVISHCRTITTNPEVPTALISYFPLLAEVSAFAGDMLSRERS